MFATNRTIAGEYIVHIAYKPRFLQYLSGPVPRIMSIKRPVAIALFCSGLLASGPCLSQTDTLESSFPVKMSFEGMERCLSFEVSKIEIDKNDIPGGTDRLYLVLEDRTFRNAPHGKHRVKFSGKDIVLEGANAFTLILPLCPPSGSHRYQLTVRAFDKDDNKIGSGSVALDFP